MHREMGRVGVTQGWGADVIPIGPMGQMWSMCSKHTHVGTVQVLMCCVIHNDHEDVHDTAHWIACAHNYLIDLAIWQRHTRCFALDLERNVWFAESIRMSCISNAGRACIHLILKNMLFSHVIQEQPVELRRVVQLTWQDAFNVEVVRSMWDGALNSSRIWQL